MRSTVHTNWTSEKQKKVLKKKDALFVLKRPVKPKNMDTAVYDQLPEELVIRAIKTKKRTIVTTLIDSIKYPRSEISGLYLMRWQIELDFKSIKTLMKMDILRCKSPDMVRKEIYVHLIVYNLIRALMVEASKRQGVVIHLELLALRLLSRPCSVFM